MMFFTISDLIPVLFELGYTDEQIIEIWHKLDKDDEYDSLFV